MQPWLVPFVAGLAVGVILSALAYVAWLVCVLWPCWRRVSAQLDAMCDMLRS